MSTTDVVDSVEAREVCLPLPQPIALAGRVITERRYAVVRVRTADGNEGHALALTRDLPVVRSVQSQVAPLIVGQAADPRSAVWPRVHRSTLDRVAMRALSLVDVALWDIAGKEAGLPVWQLLRGMSSRRRPSVDCMLVAAYPTGEAPAELGARVSARAAEGHRLLKVARLGVPEATATMLRAATRGGFPADARVVVDAAWCWRSAREAVAELEMWAHEAPLGWVEDPFDPTDVVSYCELRRSGTGGVSIGAGDDLSDRGVARALVHDAGVDVSRVDAMAIGGITGACAVARMATGAGVPVSYHVYPETHVHVAAALGGVIETFGDAAGRFDPAPTLFGGGPSFSAGRAVPPEAPGLGVDIDFDSLGELR